LNKVDKVYLTVQTSLLRKLSTPLLRVLRNLKKMREKTFNVVLLKRRKVRKKRLDLLN
jgi:hypothetical protein